MRDRRSMACVDIFVYSLILIIAAVVLYLTSTG